MENVFWFKDKLYNNNIYKIITHPHINTHTKHTKFIKKHQLTTPVSPKSSSDSSSTSHWIWIRVLIT